MLCSKCNHMHYDYCEDCMECDLFCNDFPEEYERKDGEGCIFNERTIISRLKAKQEQELETWKAIAESIIKESEERNGRSEEERGADT